MKSRSESDQGSALQSHTTPNCTSSEQCAPKLIESAHMGPSRVSRPTVFKARNPGAHLDLLHKFTWRGRVLKTVADAITSWVGETLPTLQASLSKSWEAAKNPLKDILQETCPDVQCFLQQNSNGLHCVWVEGEVSGAALTLSRGSRCEATAGDTLQDSPQARGVAMMQITSAATRHFKTFKLLHSIFSYNQWITWPCAM